MRYFADWVNDVGEQIRIEIVQVGSSATFAQFKGNAEKGFYNFSHQKINPEDPFSDPIQKGALELHVWVQNSAQQSFIDAIMQAGEGDYQMSLYVDSDLAWTGYVLPDLSEYDEMSVDRRSASLYAKDVSLLNGIEYGLQSGRETLIEIIADQLNELGFGLDIFTATSWSESNITEANDYLRQIYADKYALRTYGRSGEPDQSIPVLEALTQILSDNGLLLKQWKGWRIDQLSAYTDPSSVVYSEYASDGTLTSQSTADRRQVYNRDSTRIVMGSVNRGIPGLKSAQVRFEHRTTVSNISYPDEVILTESQTDQRSQLFLSDGNQSLELSGVVRVEAREGSTVQTVALQITIIRDGNDNYYWNGTSWVTSQTTVNIPLTELGGDIWQGGVDIITANLPADADGTLSILLNPASGDQMPAVARRTLWRDMNLRIENPSVEEGNNTSIDYYLEQTGSFSVRYDHRNTYYGDGPTSYARSALSTDAGGLNRTTAQWIRRGETTELDFHNLLLREMMDFQRGWRRQLTGSIKGLFEPDKVLAYDSEAFYYLGGSQNGLTGNWSVDFSIINIETGSDTFTIIYRTSGDSVTGTAPSGGGGETSATWNSILGKPFTTIGDNLEVVSDSLKTLDTPSFTQVELLNQATTTDHAVRADRQIMSDGGIDIIGNNDLTQDITLRLGTPEAITTSTSNSVSEGSSEIFDTSTEVFDTSTEIFGSGGHTHALDLSGRTLTFTGGDGVSVDTPGQNLGADRTWTLSADVTAPVTITGGSIDLAYANPLTVVAGELALSINDPLYVNGSSLDVRNHASGQDGIITTGAQSIYGVKTLIDNLKLSSGKYIESPTFTQGFDGSGLRVGNYDSSWRAELDDLFIRGSLFANEFIINQILALNGSDILSPGRGKIEAVTGTAPNEVITVSDPQGNDIASFVAGDIVIVQQVTPDAFDGGGQIIKRIVRQVASVSGADVTLEATTGAPTDGGSLEVGDVIVALGNTTDTDRQATIYRSVIDSGSPYARVNDGVASWSDWTGSDKAKLQYGNLTGLPFVSSNLGTVYGFWAQDNLYLTAGQTDPMAFGKDAGGTGYHGIQINANNRWFGNSVFNVGGATGIYYSGDLAEQTFDASTEVFDTSEAIFDGSVVIGSNTHIEGTLFGVDGEFTGTLSAVDGEFTGTLSAVDGTFTGTLSGVDGTFSGELSAVTGSFGAVDIDGTLTMGANGEIVNSGDTLLIDDSTFVLGASASTQTLASGSGVYGSTSGHFRAGNSSGDNFTWDGTSLEVTGEVNAQTGTLGDLSVTGTLTADGLEISKTGGLRAYGGTPVRFLDDSNALTVGQILSGDDRIALSVLNGDFLLDIGSTFYWLVSGLPTSDPSVAGAVYRDSADGNTLKVSAPPSAPSTPTNLAACKDAPYVSLSWDSSATATSYRVERSTTSGSSGFTTIATPTNTGYLDPDPSSSQSTTYWYRVSAVNAGGESSPTTAIMLDYDTLTAC